MVHLEQSIQEGSSDMKQKLKKINRGLVLGAVLIVVMIFVIIGDNRRFKKEKPVIKERIGAFIDDLDDWSVTPEKYQDVSVKYSPEDKQKEITGFAEMVDKYWYATDDIAYDFWGNNKSDFRSLINEKFRDDRMGYIIENKLSLGSVKIKKDGPDAAMAECSIDAVATVADDATVISPAGLFSASGYRDVDEMEKGIYKINQSYQCTIYLLRVDGEWKITGIFGWLNSCRTVLIEGGNEEASDPADALPEDENNNEEAAE